MRSPRILVAGCLVALACLALSGCIGEAREGPTRAASPTVTSTSPFATNDEALAAAVAAFQRYLDVHDQVAQDLELSLDLLDQVAIDPLLTLEHDGGEKQRAEGMHTTGATTFDSPIFEFAEYQPDGNLMVSAFLCLDVGNVRLIGSDGVDITPAARDDRAEFHVRAFSKEPGSDDLIIGESELWNYDGRC
ncbi:hypothetical protein HQQ81_13260 [Microbacteriaceae bacterium VKM Ac-2854]|nr:hypothetical protein [Microbacteriaceae bacterium VKM Ac-2854]